MKRFILCADDYGQNTFISQAIISLLEKKRLSAVSCMTGSYYWAKQSQWLKPFINQADIGLHFNLTEGKPLSKEMGASFLPLSRLILKAYFRQLNREAIQAELLAQLNQFISHMGRLPDFIDGHQHVHQLPIVRDVLLTVYEKKLREAGAYIRNVNMPNYLWRFNRPAYFKNLLIQLLGSYGLKKQLVRHRIPHNTTFSGSYHFGTSVPYRKLFPHFLRDIQEGGLIMCHPGSANDFGKEDLIYSSRIEEYRYLESDAFLEDCKEFSLLTRENNPSKKP